MTSIIQSIKPQHSVKICNLRKTIEVRKTKPKCSVPFKVYIYCTKDYYKKVDGYWQGEHCGKVIGEYICDKIDTYEAEFTNEDCYQDIRKFNEEKQYEYDYEIEGDWDLETSNEFENPSDCVICKNACLSFNDIKKYVFNGKDGFFRFYGYHISNLKIYDEPKELSEFGLSRPPQSWQYVEELSK